MTHRASTVALCCGLMLAAAVAWAVGWDTSGRYTYDTYDMLVGGSGIVAAVFGLVALPRARRARLPLIGAIAIAALMAYAHFSEPAPGSNDIDLTPVLLPPVVFVLGGIAILMLSLGAPRAAVSAPAAPRG